MIDERTERRIKDTADIVEVVGDFVELHKRGAEWTGLCPFHDDHSLGNFKVSGSKGMCYCFSCGKGGDVLYFLQNKLDGAMTYGDALRWLARKYCISVEGGTDGLPPVRRIERRAVPERKMLTIGNDVVRPTTADTGGDTLCGWLRGLPWSDEQRARLEHVLWAYAVGQWKDGRSVFWQVDEKGRVRSGKLMRYNDNGRRVRTEPPGWVHNLPEAGVDLKTYQFQPCMFGQHLLKMFPKAAVNVVESEKTALICATAYGEPERNVWLASGGEQFLSKLLPPLIEAKRTVWLWPDVDGVAKWQEIAKATGSSRVRVHDWLGGWTEADGNKADIADVVIRRLAETGMELRDRMAAANPAFASFIEENKDNITWDG